MLRTCNWMRLLPLLGAAYWEPDREPLPSRRPPCKPCRADHWARCERASRASAVHHAALPHCPLRARPVSAPPAAVR
jgi:hypothetical protein